MTDHIPDAGQKVSQAAKAAGWSDWQIDNASTAEWGRLERFYAIARAEALEDAANLVQANAQMCATGGYGYALLSSNAAAIRALGEQHG